MPLFDFAVTNESAKTIRDYQIQRFILYPEHWKHYPNEINLEWRKVKFNTINADSLPDDQQGVYSFVVDASIARHPASLYLLYIGMTKKQNFRTRYKQYLNENKKPKPRTHILKMLDHYSEHLWFYYAKISDIDKIEKVEDDLISAFLPPFNYQYPAKISQVMEMVFK